MNVARVSPLRSLTCRHLLAALLCLGQLLRGEGALAKAAPDVSAPSLASPALTSAVPASAVPADSVLRGSWPEGPSSALPTGAYTYEIPLLRQYPEQELTLRGEEAYAGVDFGVRQDERVERVRLVLNYSYSPALLPALSHVNVLLNSVVVATIALPEPAPGTSSHMTVDLPVSLLSGLNHLNLELIAHSKASDQGNDPLSSELWLKADPDSALELTVTPANLPGDLSQLPAPFLDVRDVRVANLPFVLPQAPDANRLESAGIVSSWLGARAGYRGVHFSTLLGVMPAHGHAVVLALPGELPGLTLPVVKRPMLAIVSNPNDPTSKLLLVTGHDEAQIREAATALVLGSKTLSGPWVRIDAPVPAVPRMPYDAPNWLPGDRPVQLGELLPANRFTIQGLRPETISVQLRLPPGSFGFDNSGAVLNLHYRYTGRVASTQSKLRVLIGNTPIQDLPLPGDTSDGDAVMHVPAYLLPSLTTLQFEYLYEFVTTRDHEVDIPGGSIFSSIDPTSTIDISHLPRYAAMPDLRAFADAGFPFTRMADLSETAVILPGQPVADDYSAYLTLMGGMGQATGYPVLGVTVANPTQIDALRRKDLLVLASGDNQPLVKTWRDYLPRGFFEPVASSNGWIHELRERLTHSHVRAQHEAAIAALYSSADHDGMVAGLESPLAHGRSVVVISGNTPDGLNAVVNMLQANRYLTGGRRADKISGGSLVVAHDGSLTTLNNDQSYFIGSLSPGLALEWFFASHLLLLLMATLVSVVLTGLLGSVFLHRRALNRIDPCTPQILHREEGRQDFHA